MVKKVVHFMPLVHSLRSSLKAFSVTYLYLDDNGAFCVHCTCRSLYFADFGFWRQSQGQNKRDLGRTNKQGELSTLPGIGEFHGKIRVIPTTEYRKDSRAYEVFGSQNDVIALCGADSCNLYSYNHDKV